jgi:hypothetical protein
MIAVLSSSVSSHCWPFSQRFLACLVKLTKLSDLSVILNTDAGTCISCENENNAVAAVSSLRKSLDVDENVVRNAVQETGSELTKITFAAEFTA